MDNFIRIHFRGICTHLVNDTPHSNKAPKDLRLKPIHDRPRPTPSHRVVLPRSDNLPITGIPRHFPRLRFRSGDIKPFPNENWPDPDKEGFVVVDLFDALSNKGVALWFDGIDEAPEMKPAAPALALKELPSVWLNTAPNAVPGRDVEAANGENVEKVAAYVDFFGGQYLAIIPSPPFYNEVLVTLRLASMPPVLVWRRPYDSRLTKRAEIVPGATIQITNIAADGDTAIDYLLHYRVTSLDFKNDPLPIWETDVKPAGTDVPYCSSGTYP